MALQKAYFKNLVTQKQMFVQFNPADLAFTKSAQYSEIAIPGLDAPVQQFVRGGTETVTVELFFDSTDYGMGANSKSVTDSNTSDPTAVYGGVNDFYELVKQDRNTHAPPKCLFAWGSPTRLAGVDQAGAVMPGPAGGALAKPVSDAPFYFTCIVESIERRFQLFSPEGSPLRARLAVRLREFQTVEQMVARLQSADHTKARILKRGQRLDQLSAAEYDSPAEWRLIAEENDLDDPRRIPPGTILRLPPIEQPSVIRAKR